MRFKNLTTKEQEIKITDRYMHTYSIYLPAGKITDLTPDQITRELLLKVRDGIFEDVDGILNIPTKVSHEPILTAEESDQPSNSSQDEEADVTEQGGTDDSVITNNDDATVPTSVGDPSVFVCHICGGEYASERGLKRHITTSHPNESNEEV